MKSTKTKDNILKAAFELTSKFGLESLSIGQLAKTVGMSKSGLFSHFNSKEKLQLMVLDYAATEFISVVVRPAIKRPQGIARLYSMMDNWVLWSGAHLPGGDPFLATIIEFNDRPGEVKDKILSLMKDMIGTFQTSIDLSVNIGHLRNCDSKQLAYEIYSNMIGFHIYNRLLNDKDSKNHFHISLDKTLEPYIIEGA